MLAALSLLHCEPAHAARLGSIHGDGADPALVADGDGWLIYTTNATVGFQTANVPLWRLAADGSSTFVGDVLPSLGRWASGGRTWAPSAALYNGRWLLYYTATDTASGDQCIGLASSANAAGPFVDDHDGPLVCQIDRGGSIDPSVAITAQGRAYLYWKSDDNAIGGRPVLWGSALSEDGKTLVGPSVALGRQDRRWEQGIVENPSMVRTSTGWYLFYSGGKWWNDSYATGYFTCTGPLGPCTKRTRTAPLWSSDGDTVGQGGASLVATGPTTLVMAHHAWDQSAVGYEASGNRATVITTVSTVGGRPRLQ